MLPLFRCVINAFLKFFEKGIILNALERMATLMYTIRNI